MTTKVMTRTMAATLIAEKLAKQADNRQLTSGSRPRRTKRTEKR
jgi:hypothetical protein